LTVIRFPRLEHPVDDVDELHRRTNDATSVCFLPLLWEMFSRIPSYHPFPPGDPRRFREQVLAFFWPSSLVDAQQLAMVEPPVFTEIASIGLLERDLLIVSASLALALYPVLELSLAIWARDRSMVRNIAIEDHLRPRTMLVSWAAALRPYHDRAEAIVLKLHSAWNRNQIIWQLEFVRDVVLADLQHFRNIFCVQ